MDSCNMDGTHYDWDFFFSLLEAGEMIDETCFYFDDEEEEGEHYLGYLPQYEQPYWVGYCDIEGGTEFDSAAELMKAPIYHGRSLKERWEHVFIISIEGMCPEDWEKYCLMKEPVPSVSPNGRKKANGITIQKARKLRDGLFIVGLVIILLSDAWKPMLLIGGFIMLSGLILDSLYNRCPHCGKHLGRNTQKYCQHCGKQIED